MEGEPIDKGKRKEVEDTQERRGSSLGHRRRHSVASNASTAAVSSYASSAKDRQSTLSPQLQQTTIPEDEEVGPSRSSRTHSRSQSLAESTRSNTRRREKAAVGFACLNCKRAHLACDVSRPCKRCVAMGRSATCSDVPHKRRGRPRLRESQQDLEIPELPTPTQSAAGGSHRRGHSRTTSLTSPYASSSRPSWTLQPRPQQPRSPRDKQAILITSPDLLIIRAPPDSQNLLCAPSRALEGRTLFELCDSDSDRAVLPDLIHAIREDLRINKLLINAHLHRNTLFNDLSPYANEDLSLVFPGSREFTVQINLIDALGRTMGVRVGMSIGLRSCDRYAYLLVTLSNEGYRVVHRRAQSIGMFPAFQLPRPQQSRTIEPERREMKEEDPDSASKRTRMSLREMIG